MMVVNIKMVKKYYHYSKGDLKRIADTCDMKALEKWSAEFQEMSEQFNRRMEQMSAQFLEEEVRLREEMDKLSLEEFSYSRTYSMDEFPKDCFSTKKMIKRIVDSTESLSFGIEVDDKKNKVTLYSQSEDGLNFIADSFKGTETRELTTTTSSTASLTTTSSTSKSGIHSSAPVVYTNSSYFGTASDTRKGSTNLQVNRANMQDADIQLKAGERKKIVSANDLGKQASKELLRPGTIGFFNGSRSSKKSKSIEGK